MVEGKNTRQQHHNSQERHCCCGIGQKIPIRSEVSVKYASKYENDTIYIIHTFVFLLF
jgi:hypothetical protein